MSKFLCVPINIKSLLQIIYTTLQGLSFSSQGHCLLSASWSFFEVASTLLFIFSWLPLWLFVCVTASGHSLSYSLGSLSFEYSHVFLYIIWLQPALYILFYSLFSIILLLSHSDLTRTPENVTLFCLPLYTSFPFWPFLTTFSGLVLVSCMNIGANFFNKILANWVSYHIKNILQHDQVRFLFFRTEFPCVALPVLELNL